MDAPEGPLVDRTSCAMSITQILHDEQIAMMRHASATLPAELDRHRLELARLAGKLARFAYPHRPYPAPSSQPG